MSLFGKKKDKETEKLEDQKVPANEEKKSSFLDGMFSSQEDDDFAALLDNSDFSDEDMEDLQSILEKYVSEDGDALLDLPADETVAEDAGIPDISMTADIAEEEPSTEGSSVVTALATEENTETDPAHDTDVAEEPRELTTDEAIEAFIKNVSLGGSISELLGENGDVSEDDQPLPNFAVVSENEGAEEIPEAVEYEAPQGIDESDFNTADTSTVGSTDMNLRIAFGLEEDIDDSDEVKEAVKKMGDHFEGDARVGKKYKPEHAEFTDATQARDLAAEFKAKKRSVSIRLLFATVFALVLVLYENITTLTELVLGKPMQFSGVLDPAVYPVVYVMASLQLLMLCALCALPELKHGVKRLFSGAPTPESMTVLALAVAVVSSYVIAFRATVAVTPVLLNAVAAMYVVMALVYSRTNIKREFISFFVAGSKRKKYAMNRVPENETLLSPENYEEDMYGDVMRVERVGFIDGFFSRMSAPDGMTTAFTAAFMGISAVAAALFAVFANKGSDAVTAVFNCIYIVALAVMPVSTHVTFSYPFYRAAKAASECDSAIIGETSLEEYAATAVVSFDDGNVFPSFGVKVQNIKIYNNARIDRVLYYASSAFSLAGGPLADVFEVATMEMGRSESVQITDADKGYLATVVDGVNITFGSFPTLTQRGFDISDEIAFDDVDFSDELSIMYMFREDVLIAKLYIKYVLDGDIDPILRQFQDYGMYLCVRTYDPNIDEYMICSKLSIKNAPVKVVRYRNADDVRGVMEKVDSGFVTYGSPKALLQLLPYCDKTIHTKRTCGALSIMSVIIALMLLAIFTMSTGLSSLNSLYVVLYHLVWVLLTSIASRLFIR